VRGTAAIRYAGGSKIRGEDSAHPQSTTPELHGASQNIGLCAAWRDFLLPRGDSRIGRPDLNKGSRQAESALVQCFHNDETKSLQTHINGGNRPHRLGDGR
jgi:hypothetical protein